MLYFDHNATTPLAPEVAETMSRALRQVYGNASSIHREGQLARRQIEQSRRIIAEFLHAAPAEFVFTSGGTEADNLAILGLVRNFPGGQKHVVTTTLEHPAVLESCRQLEREGVDVTYAPAGRDGIVDLDDIRASIRPETVLISVMHANNEIGTVQRISEIANIVHERRQAGQKIYFHSDGVQAFGKIEANVQALGVDLYSISAHKIYGPKGIGGLFVRKGTTLRAIQFGGPHERERRAGTENVPAAMAFARAVELCDMAAMTRVADLRDFFETQIFSRIGDVDINGAINARLPNTSNLLFHGVSADALAIALDLKGMAVSTGAACNSGSVDPSHALIAMGSSREDARSSVRFSFGRYNTAEDIAVLVDAVIESVSKVRASSRLERSAVV